MESESHPHLGTLKLLKRIRRKGDYVLAALNNESLELNRFRIKKFKLNDYFTLFFSSCFLGVRKPESKIFELALQVTQRNPEDCLFIDDRKENVQAAKRLGMRVIHLKNIEDLSSELMALGIKRYQKADQQE